MTLIELSDLLQGSDEWLEQRRGLVTASVVGKLVTARALTAIDYDCPDCGARPLAPCVSKVRGSGVPIKTLHSARADVAREVSAPAVLEPANNDDSRGLTALLVAERITGWTDPVYVSDAMLRGTEDEPRAVEVYSTHYAPVVTTGLMIRDEGLWRLGYSPDGLVGDDGLIEVKSRAAKSQLATILADEVPPYNIAQCQAGLLVSGREWLDYVSYCGGMPLYVKRVFPDPRWFEAIVAAVEQFERTAAEMIAQYEAATAGLPMTERTVDLDIML